jgi:hypothetical protein
VNGLVFNSFDLQNSQMTLGVVVKFSFVLVRNTGSFEPILKTSV